MLKAICFSVISVTLAIVLLCLAVIAMEHRHWDACDDVFKGFKPSAHTPTGC